MSVWWSQRSWPFTAVRTKAAWQSAESERSLRHPITSKRAAMLADIVLPGIRRTLVAAHDASGKSDRPGGTSWDTYPSTRAALAMYVFTAAVCGRRDLGIFEALVLNFARGAA